MRTDDSVPSWRSGDALQATVMARKCCATCHAAVNCCVQSSASAIGCVDRSCAQRIAAGILPTIRMSAMGEVFLISGALLVTGLASSISGTTADQRVN
jgi:hypothetical protein